jgi:hypothetical protein
MPTERVGEAIVQDGKPHPIFPGGCILLTRAPLEGAKEFEGHEGE